ncbi:hypothetical protein ACFZDI_10600 [Streptomyces sp. NPDC007907]|uniref:hypothetical protein n=1 Tax=Streptomyces sp. NPDC007907 TaxID=3364789 RepID=UPI0036EC59DA
MQRSLNAEWEVFYRDNTAALLPVPPQGPPLYEHCGRRWVGRLMARRPLPLPGDAEAPRSRSRSRSRVPAEGGHRPKRHTAPTLHAAGHPQPQPGARAGRAPTKPSG